MSEPTTEARKPVTLDEARLSLRKRLITAFEEEMAELAAIIEALSPEDTLLRNDAAVTGMALHEIKKALEVGVAGLERAARQAARPRILRPERSLKVVRP